MCALRALSLCLKLMALLLVVFGIGGWAVSTLGGFLTSAAAHSNPTVNDLTLHIFDVMPGVPTGISELDRSMAELRRLGQRQIPVRETIRALGLPPSTVGMFRVVASGIPALIFWLIASFLDRIIRRWERQQVAPLPGPPLYPYGSELPPATGPDYARSPDGTRDHPVPPERI